VSRRYIVRNLTKGTVLADAAELAGHGAARRKGLLGREGLAPGEALLIVPCEGVHTFFMRFAIDVVFIDRKKRVRKIRSNMPRRRMSFCLRAHSTIELPAGRAAQTNTQPGDQLEITPAEM